MRDIEEFFFLDTHGLDMSKVNAYRNETNGSVERSTLNVQGQAPNSTSFLFCSHILGLKGNYYYLDFGEYVPFPPFPLKEQQPNAPNQLRQT